MTGSRLFVSMSGGRTSAYMTRKLQMANWSGYSDVRVVFANTGQEHEATLEFVERCSDAWGIDVVWVEAVAHPTLRKGSTHRRVDFQSASRDGRPFEDVIAKYGIPNRSYPHCTRELKLNPMRSYLDSIGWKRGSYDTAVGIRVDEIDRMSSKADAERIVYPLVSANPATKADVNEWWSRQPFDLEIPDHLGNCTWCWKKSFNKLLRISYEQPSRLEFPLRMEREHGLSGSNRDGTHRTFFRQHVRAVDILAAPLIDGTINGEGSTLDLEVAGSCSEGCEVFSDEAE